MASKRLLDDMTAADLATAFDILDLRTAGAAALLFECSPRVIQYYLNPDKGHAIPRYFAGIVRLTVAGRVKRSELGKAPRA